LGKKIELINSKAKIKSIWAKALNVNRKNIYRTSILDQKDEKLKVQIEKVLKKHPAYGHKRIALDLHINKKRILRVMKKHGIKPPRRKVGFYTTKSTSHHKYYNLIKNLKPDRPNQIWVSDLSYLKYKGKMYYIATIIDIFTRQVLTIQFGIKHDSQLVLQTLEQAIKNTRSFPDIFHSDQGTEFMAIACTQLLEQYGVKVSVSDKGSPWQNGYQESFFSRFKAEFGDLNRFETIGRLIEAIYSYAHYYNTDRIHSALKMPPDSYAQIFVENGLQKRGT
jgi:transposase InsO family protein